MDGALFQVVQLPVKLEVLSTLTSRCNLRRACHAARWLITNVLLALIRNADANYIPISSIRHNPLFISVGSHIYSWGTHNGNHGLTNASPING